MAWVLAGERNGATPGASEVPPFEIVPQKFPISSPNEEMAGGEASKQARTDFTVQTWLGLLDADEHEVVERAFR